jgi:hypothetical protein
VLSRKPKDTGHEFTNKTLKNMRNGTREEPLIFHDFLKKEKTTACGNKLIRDSLILLNKKFGKSSVFGQY